MFKSLFCVDSGIGGQSQGVLREESQNIYLTSNHCLLFAIFLYLLNYMIPDDKRRRYLFVPGLLTAANQSVAECAVGGGGGISGHHL